MSWMLISFFVSRATRYLVNRVRVTNQLYNKQAQPPCLPSHQARHHPKSGLPKKIMRPTVQPHLSGKHHPCHLGSLRPLDGPWWINGPDAPCSQMKNLIYSTSMTRQSDRRKGVHLAKRGVEISISRFMTNVCIKSLALRV